LLRVTITPQKKNLSNTEKEFVFLCDLAAAVMLFPHDGIERDLFYLPAVCLKTILVLRQRTKQRYEAAINATIYRTVGLENRIPRAVLLLTDQRKQYSGYGPLWVNNSSRNGQFRPFTWPGAIPLDNSAIFNSLRSGTDTTQWVRETWII